MRFICNLIADSNIIKYHLKDKKDIKSFLISKTQVCENIFKRKTKLYKCITKVVFKRFFFR